MSLIQDLKEVILSFVLTCSECGKAYTENKYECIGSDDKADCLLEKKCDACRKGKYIHVHSGFACHNHKDLDYMFRSTGMILYRVE